MTNDHVIALLIAERLATLRAEAERATLATEVSTPKPRRRQWAATLRPLMTRSEPCPTC